MITEGKKTNMYKVKRFCISLPVQKSRCYKKKEKGEGGVAGGWAAGNLSRVHICKYRENEVRLKCILNILNF